MTPLVSTLIAAVRPDRTHDHCLICHRAVSPDEARMRLPGGGYVHSGCSTYRMRQQRRVRRALVR